MEPKSKDLPKYEQPPVIEVVCGVQFSPLPGFQSVHLGDFWRRIQSDYPTTEDRPPLDDIREPAQGTQVVTMLATDIPPLRRVFYIDSTTNFLLQLQSSRFLSNWRKRQPSDQYPSFEAAYSRFSRGWNDFLKFSKESGFPVPEANQYELTYVNHIHQTTEAFPVGIQRILPLLSWKTARSANFLPDPTSLACRLQFNFPESKGRLHVAVSHGLLDGKGLLVVDFTARGSARKDWSDMHDWFSMAHEWIVSGFTDLTSSDAHSTWRRVK